MIDRRVVFATATSILVAACVDGEVFGGPHGAEILGAGVGGSTVSSVATGASGAAKTSVGGTGGAGGAVAEGGAGGAGGHGSPAGGAPGVGGAGGSGGAGGAGGSPAPCPGSTTCAHDVCTQGEALDPNCHACVAAVCAADPICCDTQWDGICVAEAQDLCQ